MQSARSERRGTRQGAAERVRAPQSAPERVGSHAAALRAATGTDARAEVSLTLYKGNPGQFAAACLGAGEDMGPKHVVKRIEHLGDILIGCARPRRSLLEPSPRPGERQSLTEDELFDFQHLIDVGLPVEPRTVRRLLYADPRELLLPGTEHIGLQLRHLADLSGLVPPLRHGDEYNSTNWFRVQGFKGFRGFCSAVHRVRHDAAARLELELRDHWTAYLSLAGRRADSNVADLRYGRVVCTAGVSFTTGLP